jgi:hypothetical protein
MTEPEVTALITRWIKEHSLFTAKVVRVTSEAQSAWVVLVECANLIWQQTVSPDGEVSAPV